MTVSLAHPLRLLLPLLAGGALLLGSAVAQKKSALPTKPKRVEGEGALSLLDGRFIFGPAIDKDGDHLIVHFENGDVRVPQKLVVSWFSTTSKASYVPKNDKERAKLAKGLILFNGRWLSQKEAKKQIKRMQKKLAAKIKVQQAHKLWRNAYVFKGKNYIFEYNIPQEKFEEMRELFDLFWDVFMRKWKLKPDKKKKPTIHLFADRGDLEQISGAGGGILGFYNFGTKDLYFYWDRHDPVFTIDVMFHELQHLLVDMTNGNFLYPAWVSESMAEYYGASRWNPKAKRKKDKLTAGHLQAGRLMVVKEDIKKKRWIKLKDMIYKPRFDARDYAWGWTFVHYLFSEKKYASKYRKFYLEIAAGRGIRRVPAAAGNVTIEPETAEKLLLKRLGVKSLDILEKEWYAYIKSLQVTEVDALEMAGRYMARSGNRKEAKDMLSRAVSQGAKTPQTYSVYARLLSRSSEREEAIRMISKAMELDPLEGSHYFEKARLLGRNEGSKRDQEEILKLLGLACELDPENLEFAIAREIELESAREEERERNRRKKKGRD